MKTFLELKKNLKKDHSHLKTVKLAILGDTATQLLVQAIQGFGYEAGFHFEIFEADYDQIGRQVFDTSSELYQFEPDFMVIFHSSSKLLYKFYKLDHAGKQLFAQNHIEYISDLYQAIILKRQMACYEAAERFYEIGSPSGLAETEKYILNSVKVL